MFDAEVSTKKIKGMDLLSIFEISEVKAVVCLNDVWLIPKVLYRHLHKLYGGVRGLFPKGIKKPFSAGFINDRVLIESIGHLTGIAMGWCTVRSL